MRMKHHKMTRADYEHIAWADQLRHGIPRSYVMVFGVPVYEDDPVGRSVAARVAMAHLSVALSNEVVPAMESLTAAGRRAAATMVSFFLASGLAHDNINGMEGGK